MITPAEPKQHDFNLSVGKKNYFFNEVFVACQNIFESEFASERDKLMAAKICLAAIRQLEGDGDPDACISI